ncbi:MAG: hypothetical protein MZW92_64245 [Comamonadaceae bacterium]|nr:hypothetical protein [Comamonadaceae bacterium]
MLGETHRTSAGSAGGVRGRRRRRLWAREEVGGRNPARPRGRRCGLAGGGRPQVPRPLRRDRQSPSRRSSWCMASACIPTGA